MKGIILHGGSGTRLRPLTYTDVKQLLPIAGKPISEYALESIIELGIKEINIVIGSVGGNEVKNYYGDGSKWNIRISYTYQDQPLGIAHAIGLVKDFVRNDDFIVFLGDNYLQDGISKLYENYVSNDYDGMIALVKVKNPSQFGIAEVNNDKIVRLVEKPKEPKSDLAIAGVYFLKPMVFDVISRLKPSGRGEYEITEAYQQMIDDGRKIGYSVINGWFKDTGTVEDFLDCNRLVLDKINTNIHNQKDGISGRVSISDNVNVSTGSRVLGPCYIGNNTIIENSYIGPFTSIGSNCVIRNAEIEDSIVMDGTTIELKAGTIIRQSLVGPNVKITSNTNNGRMLKLVLGRDSRIEM